MGRFLGSSNTATAPPRKGRFLSQKVENKPSFDIGQISKSALEGSVDPFLKPLGLDKNTREAQEMYGKGREGILESPTMSKMRSGLSETPKPIDVPQLLEMVSPGASGALELASKTISPREAAKQAQGVGIDVLGGLGTDLALAKGPSLMAKAAINPLSDMAEEVGGRFLNFYIKPRQSAFSFGRNPGKAVARNIGPKLSRESLESSIESKIDELFNKMTTEVKGNKEMVDITPVREHFRTIVEKMSDFPETYSGPMEAHRSFAKDLDSFLSRSGAIQEGNKIFIKPEEALKIKQSIGKLPSWNVSDPKLGSLSKTTRETYSGFDKAIDKAVPKTKQLNEDISGLIGAKQGLEKGTMREQGKSPIGLLEILGGGFAGGGNIFSPQALGTVAAIKAMRSAPFNTTAGATAGAIGKLGRGVGNTLEATERPSLIQELLKKIIPVKGRSLIVK